MNVFLTGATGFLGEYILAELLDRGHNVWALYRNNSRKLATLRFLSSVGLPKAVNNLFWCQGDVLYIDRQWELWCKQHKALSQIDTVIHNAASTRLHLDETGEPLKTNLGGAQALMRLGECKPFSFHLISSAYVCGLVQGSIVYERNHSHPDFVTVYEESKWEAEQIWMGKATILRPSIIVGDSQTARCTSFTGWYILFQAAHLLDRLLRDASTSKRYHISIRVPAKPDGRTNIIPVDYVARAVVRIIENPDHHRKIFHITHPDPPPHQWTLDLIHRKFNLNGITLAGPDVTIEPRDRIEGMVWRQMQTLRYHLANNPVFDRTHTDIALPHLEIPQITEPMVNNLIDYAIQNNWQ
jgi:thioester reductase-like protein